MLHARLFVIWLAGSLLLAIGLAQVSAAPVAAADGPSGAPIDVVVVLDDSGSMATCSPWAEHEQLRSTDCESNQQPPSDLANLRYSAARLLIHLADDDDRIGVMRFDSTTQPLTGGDLQRAGGPDHRRELIDALQPVGTTPEAYQGHGYTRIDLGVQRAGQFFSGPADPNRPRYILFLTDGEPTQPDKSADQHKPVAQEVADLRAAGVQIFPVLLCNTSGCPATAETFLKETMGAPRTVGTAAGLLQAFSEIFTLMKPNLHVIDHRNGDGNLSWATTRSQDIQQISVVLPRSVPGELLQNDQPVGVGTPLQDDNIAVTTVGGNSFPDSTWVVRTQNGGSDGFVVVRAKTYPDMLHPPADGNPAAPRYVPANKPVLVQGAIMGAANSEPLLLDGTQMRPLSGAPGQTFWQQLQGSAGPVRLQVGAQTEPLVIQRQFVIEPKTGLPTVKANDPRETCRSGATCPLSVGFEPGPEVRDARAHVYVVETTNQQERPVFAEEMACAGRQCTNAHFQPEEGHTYIIRFLVQARSGGILFGDWDEVELAMRPAIYVRGLPNPLNLAEQGADGWPVTVVAHTSEDLGRLQATLTLTGTRDTRPVSGLLVEFGPDIHGEGEQSATLRITGYDDLPPDTYQGRITFTLGKQPVGESVAPPAPVDVQLRVRKPAASVRAISVDFGEIQFNPSENFRLDQTALVDIQFPDRPFSIRAQIQENSCPNLQLGVDADPPERQSGANYQVKLHMRSAARPERPMTCTGSLLFMGLNDNVTVVPDTPVSWRFKIPAIEWDFRGFRRDGQTVNAIEFPETREVDEKISAEALIHYTGAPPFTLKPIGLHADDGDGRVLNQSLLDVVEVGEPVKDESGPNLYRVRVTLMPRRTLDQNPLRGSTYHGELTFAIDQLPEQKTIPFTIYSPSWFQRYLQPYLLVIIVCGVIAGFVKRQQQIRKQIEEEEKRNSTPPTVLPPENDSSPPTRPPGGYPPNKRPNGPPGGLPSVSRPGAPPIRMRAGGPPPDPRPGGSPPGPRFGGPPDGFGARASTGGLRPAAPPAGGRPNGPPAGPRPPGGPKPPRGP